MGRKHEIGVIPGDGTGPEVVAEGLKVLSAASEKTDLQYNLTHYDFGGDQTFIIFNIGCLCVCHCRGSGRIWHWNNNVSFGR